MSKKAQKIHLILLSLLILGIGACQKKEVAAAKPATPKEQLVKTIKLQLIDLSTSTRLTGTVRADKLSTVSSPMDGMIEKLLVRENSLCRKGDLLAVVSSNDRTALISANRLKVLELEQKMSRISGVERDKLAQTLEETRKKQETALAMYQPYPIFATMNGMVTQRLFDQGSYVSARQPFLIITDMNTLVVRFEISEPYYSFIQKNSLLQLRFNAYPDLPVQGKLMVIQPEVDAKSRSIRVDIKPQDFAGRLLVGMMAEMDLPLQSKTGIIAIPSTAVLTKPNDNKVVYVVEEGSARERQIVTGMVSGELTEIVSGLKAGDQLVVQGQQGLKDGVGVKVMPPAKEGKSVKL